MKSFAGNNLLIELYKKAGNTTHSPRARAVRDQVRLAAGVTPVLFGRWISNKSQPSLPQATACALELGVSLDRLVILEDVADVAA